MNSELSFLANIDTNALDELYRQYQQDPESVETSWKEFFRGFEFASKQYGDSGNEVMPDEFKVINLINGYRQRGHLFTKTNPVRPEENMSPRLILKILASQKKTFPEILKLVKKLALDEPR